MRGLAETETMDWTTADDLHRQVQQLWDKGLLLGTLVRDEPPFFPRRLTLKKPGSRELSERYSEVRDWIRDLQQCAAVRIEMKPVRHSILGQNTIPSAAWLDDLNQAAALLKQQTAVDRFVELVNMTRYRHPPLLEWLHNHPLKALEWSAAWPRLLDIIDWLRYHPRPGIYLRQLDLPGIDTKFIEHHRGILITLLDLTLPEQHIDRSATGIARFETRYGFRPKPLRLRLRVLDPALLLLPGCDQDITLTREGFRALDATPAIQAVTRVFITENEINYLSFPAQPCSLVLFGAGYGFDVLANIPWLQQRQVYYWGDIDTHGFAILDQLRSHLPRAKSMLMDVDTLLAHRPFWQREVKQERRALSRLTAMEQNLYHDLCQQRYGEQVRLEQERISFGRLQDALTQLHYGSF